MITFRRVLALPHDIYAWCYRNRIAKALDDENAEQQRQDIRADAEAFERIWTDRRLDLYGKPWGGPWPADLCAYPPCEPEDGWQCPEHKPRGRHRLRLVTDRTEAGL